MWWTWTLAPSGKLERTWLIREQSRKGLRITGGTGIKVTVSKSLLFTEEDTEAQEKEEQAVGVEAPVLIPVAPSPL